MSSSDLDGVLLDDEEYEDEDDVEEDEEDILTEDE